MLYKTRIDTATGTVVNRDVLPDDWTGADGQWQIPEGHILVDAVGSPGDSWDGSNIIPQEPASVDLSDRPLSKLTILRRMTDDERATVRALRANGTDEQKYWIEEYDAAAEIDRNDPYTVAGFEAVFGVERAADLLAPTE